MIAVRNCGRFLSQFKICHATVCVLSCGPTGVGEENKNKKVKLIALFRSPTPQVYRLLSLGLQISLLFDAAKLAISHGATKLFSFPLGFGATKIELARQICVCSPNCKLGSKKYAANEDFFFWAKNKYYLNLTPAVLQHCPDHNILRCQT